jgi:hypothetical protein
MLNTYAVRNLLTLISESGKHAPRCRISKAPARGVPKRVWSRTLPLANEGSQVHKLGRTMAHVYRSVIHFLSKPKRDIIADLENIYAWFTEDNDDRSLSPLVCSVLAATLVTGALGQTQTASEQTEPAGSTVGTVVSVSRQTMTLRIRDNQFQAIRFQQQHGSAEGTHPRESHSRGIQRNG